MDTRHYDEISDRPDLSERKEMEENIKLERAIRDAKPLSDTPSEPAEPTAEQISGFERSYGDTEGADHVVGDAEGNNWSKRVGAEHHMDVAKELGPNVKSFEEPFHPERTGKMNNVDIVTKDGYAVECKTSWGDRASPSTVGNAHRQAETRLEPNVENKNYRGVVVVFPDGKLTGEAAVKASNYETVNPNIRYCEKNQLNRTLDQMRREI